MPKRQRQKKTRRLASVPSPGPATCSPLSTRLTRRNSSTRCLPDKVLAKVAIVSRHGSGASGGGGVQPSLETLAKEVGCKSDDERCIVEKSLLSHREKSSLGCLLSP